MTRSGASISRIVGRTPADLLGQVSALNPLRTTQGRKTTSTRGLPAAPITVSELQTVKRSDLEPYLAELEGDHLYRDHLDNASKPASTDGGLLSPKPKSKLPDLGAVPPLYMQADFDLSLPTIFDAVTQVTAEDTGETLSIGDLGTDQMLQERLSHYLDVVEQHLAAEIAHRSASFFSALSNLQSLNAQSATALDRAASLKKELAEVDERTAKKGLAVTRSGIRRRRMQDVATAIERLKEIWKAIDQAEELTRHGEWEAALGIVEELSAAYTQDAPVRLNKLHALDAIPDKLTHLRKQIGRSLQGELIGVLVHELEEQLERPTGDFEAFKVKEQASDRTRPLVRGLARCGHGPIEEAIKGWRGSVLASVRQTIRKVRRRESYLVAQLTLRQGLPASEVASTNEDLADSTIIEFVLPNLRSPELKLQAEAAHRKC
jgi:vacuolar protein sorting-associated protein 54